MTSRYSEKALHCVTISGYFHVRYTLFMIFSYSCKHFFSHDVKIDVKNPSYVASLRMIIIVLLSVHEKYHK